MRWGITDVPSNAIARALVTGLLLALAAACATSVGDHPGGRDTTGGTDASTSDQVTSDLAGGDHGGKDTGTPDETGPDAAVDVPGDDQGGPDVPAVTCAACHGGEANAAPPFDTDGDSDTTVVTVGAHQTHLGQPRGLTVPLQCEQCHVVPSTVDAPTHMDGSPAELTFGPLAAADGAAPVWDRDAATCSSVYCHGATLNGGGTNHQPRWTKVDGTQAACGTCHGVPPPAPHAQNDDCGACHTATASGQEIAHPDKHVDGVLEVDTTNLACNACHGSEANDAPPVDTKGNSSTTLPSVGAHQAHLTGLHALSKPLTCEHCHVVPDAADAAGHIDASPAELTFGSLARTGGANATWTHATASCSTVYCHGATLKGGTVPSPTWTKVDGTQDACGACHGLPPKTGRHPGNFGDHGFMGKDCSNCHNGIANSSGSAVTNATLHVNGVKDVALKNGGTWSTDNKSCNPTCHGNEHW